MPVKKSPAVPKGSSLEELTLPGVSSIKQKLKVMAATVVQWLYTWQILQHCCDSMDANNLSVVEMFVMQCF